MFGRRKMTLNDGEAHTAKYRTCNILIINDLFGGEGGIRTHVPLTGQDAFEAPPLRPLRYLSVEGDALKRTLDYSLLPSGQPFLEFTSPRRRSGR